jgi:hypothetical protein
MLIATESTVYYSGGTGAWRAPAVRFKGHGVACVAEAAGVGVIALEDSHLMFLAERGSRMLTTAVARPITALLVLKADPLDVLIGAEGPHLYRLSMGQGPADRVRGFESACGRARWPALSSSKGPAPADEPPAVRSLAATPDGWIYAAVHVGGIVRSADGGESWEPLAGGLDGHVHQAAVSPAAPGRIYAATASGVYLSEDRGRSWVCRADDLAAGDGRAVAVHPRDPDLVLAAISDGPEGDGARGRLYRSEDAGGRWTQVREAFPEPAQGPIDTHRVAFSAEGSAWAAVGRKLFRGTGRAAQWESVWEAPQPIRMIASREGKS